MKYLKHYTTKRAFIVVLIFLTFNIYAQNEQELELWEKEKDFSLVPLISEKVTGAPAAMPGGYFRYGPQQILIYVEKDEKLQFIIKHQHGIGWFYWIKNQDGETIKSGRSIQSEFITCPIQKPGIYSLIFDTKGNWGLLNILNQYAVIKASSEKHALNIIHGTGKSKGLYFFVPKKTEEFSIGINAPEKDVSMQLELFAPSGKKVLDETGDFNKFVGKKIKVTEGMDGIWRLKIDCKGDSKIYLKGIPPYLSNSPERLLVPEEIKPKVKSQN